MKRVASNFKALIKRIFSGKGYVEVAGSIIPSPDKRWCGPQFKNDEFYLKTAEAEAQRIIDHFGFSLQSRILDVGCGQGRLAIGIQRVVGDVDYLGIDVHAPSITWCQKHIHEVHKSFKFNHININNERYNSNGSKIDSNFQFEIKDKSIDIIYLYSVFSHTTEEDMRAYLTDFSRILDDNGKIFFTTFAEENVPNFIINPENYYIQRNSPLHVVRYEKGYIFSILSELGFSIEHFEHRAEIAGQSSFYLAKKPL